MGIKSKIKNSLVKTPKRMSQVEIDFRLGVSNEDLRKKYNCRFLFLDYYLNTRRVVRKRPDIDILLDTMVENKEITKEENKICRMLTESTICTILKEENIKDIKWLNKNLGYWNSPNSFRTEIKRRLDEENQSISKIAKELYMKEDLLSMFIVKMRDEEEVERMKNLKKK